jgi:hypothetical protein
MGDGMNYVLRTVAANRISRNGFVWPESGPVVCPDWDAKPECGNGLFGFLWGEGDGSLADWSQDAIWLVVAIDEWVDLGGKVKFPRGVVVFSGSRLDATNEIIRLGAKGAVIGSTATAGYYGTATAGYYGTATAGYSGIIQIKHWDGKRHRIITGYVGENGIEANTAYKLTDGKLVKA